MVPRLFYVSLGAAAGVVAVRRAARLASSLSPETMAGSLVQSVQDFVADVREGMAEREEELRDALGIDGDPDDEADSGYPDQGMDELMVTDLAASNGRRAS